MGRKAAPAVEAVFVSKGEIGRHLGVSDLATIDRWIAEGRFPPPHSRPGPRHCVWLRCHWNSYVKDGKWPRSAFPHR